MGCLKDSIRGMFDLRLQIVHFRQSRRAVAICFICTIVGLTAYAFLRSTPYYFVCHLLAAFALPILFAAVAPRAPLVFLLGCGASGLLHFGHELYFDPASKDAWVINIDHLVAGGIGIMAALPVYFIWLNPPAPKTPGN